MRKPSSALLLCSLSTAVLLVRADQEVVRLTLDSNVVHRIAVAVDRVTTLAFPSDIAGLEGAFISQQPTLTTRFALSFQPGGRYFSIRALGTNASANLNVILGRVIYALEFYQSAQPVYVVEFAKATPARPVTSLADPAPAPTNDLIPRPPVTGAAGPLAGPGPSARTNSARSSPAPGPPAARPAAAANGHAMGSSAPLPSAAPALRSRGRQIYQASPSAPPAASTLSTPPAPLVPEPSNQTVSTPRSLYPPAAPAPAPSGVRPATLNTVHRPGINYQQVSYRSADYTVSYPVYRSYTYSYPHRDNWWSYRRPATAVHAGFSLSIGSCRSTSFRRVPFL